MRRTSASLCAAVLPLCTLLIGFAAWPARADAPEATEAVTAPDRARALFDQGMQQTNTGALHLARASLSESLALLEKPSTRLNLGIVEVRLGLLTDAHRTLLPLVERAEIEAKTRDRAQALCGEIERRVAVVTLRTAPETAKVSVDGVQVPHESGVLVLALSPGEHRIRAQAPEHETSELVLQVEAGTKREEGVALTSVATVSTGASLAVPALEATNPPPLGRAPAAATAPDPAEKPAKSRRVWWWTGAAVLGAAGAALAVGLATRDDSGRSVEKPFGPAGTVKLGR